MQASAVSRPAASRGALARLVRDNGLALVMFGLFAVFLVGQAATGYRAYNADQRAHGERPATVGAYLTSGHFVEAVFENWESEFLQMAAYVFFTAFLFQRGSSESKDPDADAPHPSDQDPRAARGRHEVPGPVRRGGLALLLYEHSLALALVGLFLLSFVLHAAGGERAYNEEQRAHGGQTVSLVHFLGTSRFWFESFQNWQSEFLSVGALLVLSIVLRQRGSPESKPVAAPHRQTGDG